MSSGGFDLFERLRERKWEVISGILGLVLILIYEVDWTEPEPVRGQWPTGLPNIIYSAEPPTGPYACAPGAPAPVSMDFCWAGPPADMLRGCKTKIRDGTVCIVSNCQPLAGPEERYEVWVACSYQVSPSNRN